MHWEFEVSLAVPLAFCNLALGLGHLCAGRWALGPFMQKWLSTSPVHSQEYVPSPWEKEWLDNSNIYAKSGNCNKLREQAVLSKVWD